MTRHRIIASVREGRRGNAIAKHLYSQLSGFVMKTYMVLWNSAVTQFG